MDDIHERVALTNYHPTVDATTDDLIRYTDCHFNYVPLAKELVLTPEAEEIVKIYLKGDIKSWYISSLPDEPKEPVEILDGYEDIRITLTPVSPDVFEYLKTCSMLCRGTAIARAMGSVCIHSADQPVYQFAQKVQSYFEKIFTGFGRDDILIRGTDVVASFDHELVQSYSSVRFHEKIVKDFTGHHTVISFFPE